MCFILVKKNPAYNQISFCAVVKSGHSFMSNILAEMNNISEARSTRSVRDENLKAILNISLVIEIDCMESKILGDTGSPCLD